MYLREHFFPKKQWDLQSCELMVDISQSQADSPEVSSLQNWRKFPPTISFTAAHCLQGQSWEENGCFLLYAQKGAPFTK